jgi:hypothetical protein
MTLWLALGQKSDTMQDRRFLTFLQSILLGLNDSFLSFFKSNLYSKKDWLALEQKSDTMPDLSTGRKSDTMQDW